jgi:hypothetical protein
MPRLNFVDKFLRKPPIFKFLENMFIKSGLVYVHSGDVHSNLLYNKLIPYKDGKFYSNVR